MLETKPIKDTDLGGRHPNTVGQSQIRMKEFLIG